MRIGEKHNILWIAVWIISALAPVAAQQQLQGFYNGQIRYVYRGVTAVIQLDIKETADNKYAVIVRTREAKRNSVFGCDILLQGTMEDNTLVLREPIVVSASQLGYYECLFFHTAYLKITEQLDAIELKGVLKFKDEETIARVNVSRNDSAVSFVTEEQIKEGERMRNEFTKLQAVSANDWAPLLFSARQKVLIDTLSVKMGQPLTLRIKGYQASGYDTLSVFVNDTLYTSRHGVTGLAFEIPIPTHVADTVRVVLISHHTPPLRYYFLTLQPRYGDFKMSDRKYSITNAFNQELRIYITP